MMEYTVIRGGDGPEEDDRYFRKFLFEVNNHIKEGWTPLGGISIETIGNEGLVLLAQAMIKEKEDA